MKSFNVDSISKTLITNANKSLTKNGIEFSDLKNVVENQVDDYELALLTSSFVQGLATPMSDIDIVCITNGEVLGQRAAAQIFEKNRRFEVILFSKAEIKAATEYLERINCQDLPRVAKALLSWNRINVVRFKYFERLINSVSCDQMTPYINYLPKLAKVWSIVSYDRARKFLIYAILAQRAGEKRSPTVYAFKAAVQLMDMLLSSYGLVYTNPKWYLMRWKRFIDANPNIVASDSTIEALTTCWPRILTGFELGRKDESLLHDLMSVLNLIERREGFDLFWSNAQTIYNHKGTLESFSGDEGVWIDPKSTFVFAADIKQALIPVTSLSSVFELSQHHAATLLRSTRAHLVDFSIAGYTI